MLSKSHEIENGLIIYLERTSGPMSIEDCESNETRIFYWIDYIRVGTQAVKLHVYFINICLISYHNLHPLDWIGRGTMTGMWTKLKQQ